MAEETNKKPTRTVLPQKLGGGPHGLGDPDDKSLRKVESDILIPNKVRERSRKEKCVDEVKQFVRCGRDAHFLIHFKCRGERDILVDCLSQWFHDKDFNEECKQQYLAERTEFRRTGIGAKQKRKDRII